MPRVIEPDVTGAISLAECTAALDEHGFDPRDDESLDHAASQLKMLANNRTFLGDMLIDELARGYGHESHDNSYGPQVIMLAPAGREDYFMRANIWPSPQEHSFRASGGASFVYGLPHDHNFSFLTAGYFGPGYWSDYYEYDFARVAGWTGEPVDLTFVERARLEEGKIMLYRAHRDVHSQLPADSLSVSLNVMHADPAQGWLDQYGFDLEGGKVSRILSHGSSEAFIHIAVGMGSEDALDLAHGFMNRHPSDRMRLHATAALASVAADDAARESVWRSAEQSGSLLLAGEARLRLRADQNPAPASASIAA